MYNNPPGDGVEWLQIPSKHPKMARYTVPECLFVGKGPMPFATEQVSRFTTFIIPCSEFAKIAHPYFREIWRSPVDQTNVAGAAYEIWASWPDNRVRCGGVYYYPTRYILVRLGHSVATGCRDATVILESAPAGGHGKARLALRDAALNFAWKEKETGVPAWESESPVPADTRTVQSRSGRLVTIHAASHLLEVPG